MKKKGIKGIIFDLDFTLFNHTLIKKKFFCALEKWGPKIVLDWAKKNYSELEKGSDPFSLIGRLLSKYPFDKGKRFREEFLSMFELEQKQIAFLISAIQNKGLSVCVLTNASTYRVENMLAALHLSPHHLIICNTLGISKPNPLVFTKALKSMGLSSGEVLSVGDNFINDILPAKLLGCTTFFYSHVSKFFSRIPKAVNPFVDYMSNDLTDLLQIIH
jgi:HAD superfamily hydrolase (TIGR01549 family)